MNRQEECKKLQEFISEKIGLSVNVLYGEVDNLGEWFYIPRKSYNLKYRLGVSFSSADSYVNKILNDLPSDIVLSTMDKS